MSNLQSINEDEEFIICDSNVNIEALPLKERKVIEAQDDKAKYDKIVNNLETIHKKINTITTIISYGKWLLLLL